MKTTIVFFTIVLFLTIGAYGQGRNNWIISFGGGKLLYDASLDQLKDDSLQITSGGNTEWYALADIARMELSDKQSTSVRDGIIGAVVLGGIGYGIGAIEDNHQKQYGESSDKKYLWGASGFLLGGIGGALMGNTATVDVEYEMKGLELKEKRSIVENIIREKGSTLSSKSNQADIIRLRKGGNVRGRITENEGDSTITIHTVEGSDFTYPRSEVLFVERKITETQPEQMENKGVTSLGEGLGLEVQAGVAVPLGNFASETEGYAVTGFTFNANMTYPLYMNDEQTLLVQSLTTGSVTINETGIEVPPGAPFDVGLWILAWPTTGIRVLKKEYNNIAFFLAGQAGVMAGTYPSISLNETGGLHELTSGTTVSFAYRIAAGAMIKDRFLVEANYLYSNPSYNVVETKNNFGNPQTLKGTIQQQTSLLSLTVGLVF